MKFTIFYTIVIVALISAASHLDYREGKDPYCSGVAQGKTPDYLKIAKQVCK